MGSVEKLLNDVSQAIKGYQKPTKAISTSSGATSEPTQEQLKQAILKLKVFLQQSVGSILLDNEARAKFQKIAGLLLDKPDLLGASRHALLSFYLEFRKHGEQSQCCSKSKEKVKSREEEQHKSLAALNEHHVALQHTATELTELNQAVQKLELELLACKKKRTEKQKELHRMYSSMSQEAETICKTEEELETMHEEIVRLQKMAEVGWKGLTVAFEDLN
ncbi:trichohyalin-like isoform X2 [Fagus crenata]